jgi:hypothetical protein
MEEGEGCRRKEGSMEKRLERKNSMQDFGLSLLF